MSDEIGEQWVIPSQDDFSLGIADRVRARSPLTANNPFFYVALGVNTFLRFCRSLDPTNQLDLITKVRSYGPLWRDVVREFTPQRLDQIQEEMDRQRAFPEPFAEAMLYIVLTLEILITSAAKLCPKLQDLFHSECRQHLLEECTPERMGQLREAAAKAGYYTVH